jgi:hypothetical protein
MAPLSATEPTTMWRSSTQPRLATTSPPATAPTENIVYTNVNVPSLPCRVCSTSRGSVTLKL